MKTITLSDITQDDFDSAAATVTAGVKAYNRKLDTRVGTVLRDLLINPDAAIGSVMAGQIAEVRRTSSLKLLKDAQEAGDDIDQDDVISILSNFNITPSSGTRARGIVKIVVSDADIAHALSAGDVFKTIDGIEFTVDEQVVAATDETDSSRKYRTTELYSGTAGYFFLVNMTSSAVGSAGNIQAGTALDPESTLPSFVMAEAYEDFGGGSDVQNLEDTINGIPSALSLRGFVNKNATEGMLKSEFNGGDHPIVAVSTVGYGNDAQLRDKHNLFGIGVGGRIDVYVRNFTNFYTSTAVFNGELMKSSAGEYEIDEKGAKYSISVPPGAFPGASWVKSVADPFSKGEDESDELVLSSLSFSASRTADVSGSGHDFDERKENEKVEAFNTVWQGFDIVLDEVPADGRITDLKSLEDGSVAGQEDHEIDENGNSVTFYRTWSKNRMFKVSVYCLPQASELQEYVDRDDVRNVAVDVVVRCPIVCNVSVNAVVYCNPKKPIEEGTARTKICSYINNLGFVGRLTRSEIVQILKNMGATSVEMPDKDMLTGVLHDAKGVEHVLSGDAIDVASVEDGKSMLTKDTVVFVAEKSNVQVTIVPRG